jgi:hypothetical protein
MSSLIRKEKMDLQNLFHKKYKRKNFVVTLAVTTTGYMVMRSVLYKIFGKQHAENSTGKSRINVKINSLAVRRSKLPSEKTKIGDTNV